MLMSPRARHWVKLILGWVFVVLGVAGLVLPVLQGFLFLAVGLSLLSTESPMVARWVERMRRCFPRLAAGMDVSKEKASELLARITRRCD
ncbi:MAG: YbaN family protein [Rhodospirillales bacterium]|nr:YbaN family protein [Rhodospirillales bacterium]